MPHKNELSAHKKAVKPSTLGIAIAKPMHLSIVDNNTLTALVIDDEPQIRRLVRNALNADSGFVRVGRDDTEGAPELRVIEAATGQEGIDFAAGEDPALVILDLGLPDMEGIAVCREIRRWSSAPIIVLSARHADTEKAALLDAGADDYITKPFSNVELMARVRAQFRRARAPMRANQAANAPVALGELTIDVPRRRVERRSALIHLTPTEWSLLRAFIAHPRHTLTHRQLFQEVWGNASGDAQQYLRVYVGHLRRKIEDDPLRPRYIHTEAGVGYRFEPDGEA
jgi:two-component system KDP operon response regulator KdpE